mmetsp:Transcript_25489/g.49851  ORF Transcript_25489/g.49851 Transcript_25489/m.49851 type:complete len:353 (+) Transcript_25489:1463-2521(+)
MQFSAGRRVFKKLVHSVVHWGIIHCVLREAGSLLHASPDQVGSPSCRIRTAASPFRETVELLCARLVESFAHPLQPLRHLAGVVVGDTELHLCFRCRVQGMHFQEVVMHKLQKVDEKRGKHRCRGGKSNLERRLDPSPSEDFLGIILDRERRRGSSRRGHGFSFSLILLSSRGEGMDLLVLHREKNEVDTQPRLKDDPWTRDPAGQGGHTKGAGELEKTDHVCGQGGKADGLLKGDHRQSCVLVEPGENADEDGQRKSGQCHNLFPDGRQNSPSPFGFEELLLQSVPVGDQQRCGDDQADHVVDERKPGCEPSGGALLRNHPKSHTDSALSNRVEGPERSVQNSRDVRKEDQ